MKQGKASLSGNYDRKVEPNPRAINPGGVEALGTKFVHRQFVTPINAGRGFYGPTPQPQQQGPGGGRTIRPCGSQGRH